MRQHHARVRRDDDSDRQQERQERVGVAEKADEGCDDAADHDPRGATQRLDTERVAQVRQRKRKRVEVDVGRGDERHEEDEDRHADQALGREQAHDVGASRAVVGKESDQGEQAVADHPAEVRRDRHVTRPLREARDIGGDGCSGDPVGHDDRHRGAERQGAFRHERGDVAETAARAQRLDDEAHHAPCRKPLWPLQP